MADALALHPTDGSHWLHPERSEGDAAVDRRRRLGDQSTDKHATLNLVVVDINIYTEAPETHQVKILTYIYVDINDVRDYTPKHNGFVAAATGAKSVNGGSPMLSRLSIAQRLVKEVHTARPIAARLASAFTPPSNLAPVPHEALCYGCMVGIVVPAHHHIASSEIPPDDLDIELNKAPPLCPTETNLVTGA